MSNPSTGRALFQKIKPIINIINKIYSILPRKIFKATWFLIDGFPGKIGILLRYLHFYRLAEKCGDNVMIGVRCVILNHDKISVGNNVTIHTNAYIDGLGGINIGDNVSIAHNCSIVSFEHTYADTSLPIKYNPLSTQEIIIEDDIWIGCGVRVLAGVKLTKRTIVAAGSVIIRGEYKSGILAGVPAKIKRDF